MKILLSFTHPEVVPVWVSFSCWTQKKILWRILVAKQLTVSIDLYSMKKNTMEVNGYY